jgi:diguanylate cyclase (GGDEF)-like protein
VARKEGTLSGRPLRVLVSQDDPLLLELITASLERDGFVVVACRDLLSASAQAVPTGHDAIITEFPEEIGVATEEGADEPSEVDEALTIVGRHPAHRFGDAPVTPEAARDVLAYALGVPLCELEKLSGDSAALALARLQSLVNRLLSVSGVVDDLTGALRRDVGLESARRELDRGRRTGQRAVVAMVDVDGLKAVNDSAGHLADDQLLRSTGGALRKSLRSYDLVVRYGGDEFFCMLADLSVEEAEDRFVEVGKTLHECCGAAVSVGLTATRPDDTLENCIARADQALYARRAERRGRASITR